VFVSGTTARAPHLDGDAYEQMTGAIATVVAALGEAGADLRHVVRTVIYVVDMADVSLVARAHQDAFGAVSSRKHPRAGCRPDAGYRPDRNRSDSCRSRLIDLARSKVLRTRASSARSVICLRQTLREPHILHPCYARILTAKGQPSGARTSSIKPTSEHRRPSSQGGAETTTAARYKVSRRFLGGLPDICDTVSGAELAVAPGSSAV